MNAMPAPAIDPGFEIAEIVNIVTIARRRGAAAVETINLNALARKVEHLCARISCLSIDQGRRYSDLIVGLLADLDALADEMQIERDGVENQIARQSGTGGPDRG